MSEQVARLSAKLDTVEAKVRLWEQRYAGDVPISFLSATARQNLKLTALKMNFCRLAVDALSERLRVAGFLIDGASDAALWQSWRDQGMEDGAAQAITDALMCGRGFVSVWGDTDGPVVNPEAPGQCLIERDPMTREPVVGLKRWRADSRGWAILYERDKVSTFVSASHVPEGGVIPATGWESRGVLPNPLGVLPLVQITNRGRTTDVHGVSEMDAIADANDALVKVYLDQLTTSEAYSRPRRWASGIEVNEDDDGNPVDPFAGSDRTWIAENESARFGQFNESDLSGYDGLTRSLLSRIGSLSGLPAHYLFSEQQPTSGEEVRAKEISLVARAEQKITTFTQPLAQVARLMVAVRDGRDPRRVRAEVTWRDPATRTLAQEADAIVKLATGDRPVLPLSEARARLGYSPEQIKALEREDAAEAALRLATRTQGAA